MTPEFLIWSIEHNAWWRPSADGYTGNRELAGRYSFEKATIIVNAANELILPSDPPNEAMVPA